MHRPDEEPPAEKQTRDLKDTLHAARQSRTAQAFLMWMQNSYELWRG